MGKVVTVLRVSPAEGVDAEELRKKVEAVEGCTSARVEDFVFGTKVVKASFVCEDAEGKDFESEVKKLEGVNEVQVEECGLVS